MKIERADVSFPGKADAADFSFVVDSEAVPPFDGPTITAVRPLTPYRKSYERAVGRDDIAATDGGHVVFVATDAGRLIGYIVLSRKWNGFASIDELAVDIPARRSGAGRQLMDAALAWARQNQAALLQTWQELNG